MKSFRVMGRVLKATYDELFLLVWVSVLWWLGVLLIITAAPATMGLNRVANRIANYKRVDSSFFWEGGKEYFWRSWPLFLLNFLLPVGVAFNIWFYGVNEGWMRVVAVLWMWVLILLLMMGQYFFPLFWQQEDRGLILILRNALLLTLRYPLYTFLMLIFQILLLVISIALAVPLFLLTPGMMALGANFALTGLLQEMGMAPQPPESYKRGR